MTKVARLFEPLGAPIRRLYRMAWPGMGSHPQQNDFELHAARVRVITDEEEIRRWRESAEREPNPPTDTNFPLEVPDSPIGRADVNAWRKIGRRRGRRPPTG